MKNEFFGLSQRWGLKSGLFKQNLAQSPKQNLTQSPKTQATQVRQGDFSLSLSRLVSPLFEFKGLFLAFLLILAPQGLKAESNGVFVGVQAGVARVERDTTQIDITYDWVTYNASRRTFTPLNNTHFNSTRFGGLLGYKHFISDELGFRAYFVFDGKFQAGSETKDFKTFNFNLNVDALYNFYSNKQRFSNIGVFLGGSLGGV